MSMPFRIFSCSRCRFSGSDIVVSGRFSYEWQSNYLLLSSELGWCNECNDIVPVEVLPNEQKLENLKSEIEENSQHLAQSLDRLEKSRPWFKKLFKISVNLAIPEIRFLQNECEYQRYKMKREEQLLSLLKYRKSAPRCLECGSIDCFPMPKLPTLPEANYPFFSSESKQPPAEIGLKHPGCGGDLLVKFSGAWISIKEKHRIYDIEGQFVREEN